MTILMHVLNNKFNTSLLSTFFCNVVAEFASRSVKTSLLEKELCIMMVVGRKHQRRFPLTDESKIIVMKYI